MNYKMLVYEKINISDGIDADMSINQKNVCFIISGIF